MQLKTAAPNAGLILGICLALLVAALALSGLVGQLLHWSPGQAPADAQYMKVNASVALLAGCGGWLLLQCRARVAVWLGYAGAGVMAAIAGATLIEHLAGVDLKIDTLLAPDASFVVTGHPGRASPAVCASLLLGAVAIALTRAQSERAEDFRQFARLASLAIPLFAIALHIYDPRALNVVDGFETTPIGTAAALALLLVAIGTDRRSTSLRWNVAFVGVVIMAPLVALTVRFASDERETALSAAGDRLATVVRLIAERQDSVIQQTRQMLNFLARSESVRTFSEDCEWELAEYAPVNSWVRALYTVDGDGVVRCSDKPPSVSLNVSDREYVKQAFATKRFTISGFILARVSGAPRIAIAQPVMDSSVKMLVVASVDVEALAGSIDDLGDDLTRGETVTLVDRSGVVIARRPRSDAQIGATLGDATFVSEALAGPGRTFEAADVDGRASLFHARRVLDGTATLIVGAPKREVVRPVDVRLNRQLKLIAAILFGSLALGVVASETLVVRPLKRLIDYARRLEAGDFTAHPNVRGAAELGALGRALTVSAAAIADRERRLVEAEALFRGLFDHSPDAKAVVRVDAQGRFSIETWNPAAIEATGLPTAQVIGRAPRDVFQGGRGETLEADLRRTLALGRVTTVEREPNIGRQQSNIYEIVLVPLRGADGQIERIFLSAHDISERKRVERLKSEFVSTVSHELRTPLTSIAGSLGLLTGGAAGPLAERAKHLIAIAHSNSLRLVRLINDILDIEKIEAGRMTFDLKSLVIRDIVIQAIGGLRSYADEYGVDVELSPGGQGLMVYGDEDRLTQVITNLVSNAVKFSPRGRPVTVSISAEGEAVAIIVKDCGPGIPESFRSRIFAKFAQADSSDNRRKGGTGLGLAIVREIVERHAGAIGYRTELGQGTEFEVRLPRHVVRERVSAPVFLDSPQLPKVLVCEDDALIAAILAEQMRDAGFEALTAGTIKGALELVERNDLDAILVDLHLPDGDGLSFVQDLRDTAKGKDIPVIVVSADTEKGRADRRAPGLGVAAWVGKPVDTTRLTRIIRQKLAPAPDRLSILHVEDDVDLCNVVKAALAPMADVTSVGSLADARAQIAATRFDLAILDVALEDGSGLDLLAALERAPTPVVIFSARDVDRDVAADAALIKSRTSLAGLIQEVERIAAQRASQPVEASRSYG